MNTKRNWEKPIRRLELLMRLKSFPVAFKMLEHREDIAKVPFIRRLKHKSTLCQMISLVRNFDWTVGADLDDFMSAMCPSIIGLTDIPPYMREGIFRSVVWTKSRADGKKYENAIPRLPLNKYEALVMAPLVYNPFDPDIVLIYANPAQMMLLINALQFEAYEVMQFHCVGESSCSDAIARCYLTGKPSLTIPCYGERRYGHAQDDELVMAIPENLMDKALRGMEALYRRGIRYPISYAGAESDVADAFPASYGGQARITRLQGNDNRVLLGVTGGIATGKTTVAAMLEELGAAVIDFDLLRREVVEPEKPAWQDIVGFFGEQVLKEDRSLDWEKLGETAARDMEMRKKLEGFIQPRIAAEFSRLVEAHAGKDPDAIIACVIPLLIETNMHPLFHHLLMVFCPEEEQIRRLMMRGLSEERASAVVRSALSVEEKKGYCDLIVDTTGGADETRKQVGELWSRLRQMQQSRRKAEEAH